MTDITHLSFGRCEVDLTCREVWLDGKARPLEPRPFDLLAHLLRNRDRVVTKQELLHRIWPRDSVSPSARARALMKVRPAHGDDGHAGNGQTSGRTYRVRWIVDGHWRNPWYPASETHRPRYIDAYVKGPEGAPLKLRETVKVWRDPSERSAR